MRDFLTTHELEKIRNDHTSGSQLTRLSIDKLFNELDIAKEDVRGIELKIDAVYAEKGALQAEIVFLKGQIEGYKMKYENTGAMFGRQNQLAIIEENKQLRAALEFYANANAIYDSGEKAIKALEDNK